ncbi:inositol monophosphatase family protein [Weissella diestrammenae]|uniref:Inositol monophosphatase family protein n=1 Tax=Weissella diestrammenae TaxID=1162633 RepID=A0A7G9T5E9_9LACO|nr:inositol monophosphatase family protein [Weissella diestrammenae]MCM0583183.1 inositol monophosphatase family protein [Weissella diestrammenae]QNN75324.1 inositol monophosphatase family protein [Weissella diestrammenae]
MGDRITHLTKLDQTVLKWLADVQATVMKRIQQKVTVETKSNYRDLVTNIDREVEQYYVSAIRMFDPHAKILGEEGFGDQVKDMKGHVWLVDPIDGTMNFVKQKSEFATMLAYFEDGKPVMAWIMDVAQNETIHGGPDYGVYLNGQLMSKQVDSQLATGLVILSGARLLYEEYGFSEIAKSALGYRVYGSAGISFMHVLKGQANAYASYMKPWDYAAGMILSQSIGLKVGTIDGTPVNVLLSSVILTATQGTFDDIMVLEAKL